MFQKDSRYQKSPVFKTETSIPSFFKGVRPRIPTKATPVLEHTVQEGERPDLLARHYYNDPRQWWRILDANPDIFYAGDLTPQGARHETEEEKIGMVILIPKAEE